MNNAKISARETCAREDLQAWRDLGAFFMPDELEWRINTANYALDKAKVLTYITARHVMNRLDDVIGPGNWETRVAPLPNAVGFISKLRIRWPSGKESHHEDVSDVSDIEAIKGGASGALKRVVVHVNIGRYLYGLPAQWVDLVQQRAKGVRGYEYYYRKKDARDESKPHGARYWLPPQLPEEFLPPEYVQTLRDSTQFDEVPIPPAPKREPGEDTSTQRAELLDRARLELNRRNFSFSHDAEQARKVLVDCWATPDWAEIQAMDPAQIQAGLDNLSTAYPLEA